MKKAIWIFLFIGFSTLFVVLGPVWGQEVVRVSVDSAGNQANGNSQLPTQAPAISADGRYVTFESDANDLVGNDNGGIDIFVHDRDADGDGIFDEGGVGDIETTRVSLASDGTGGGGGDSTNPAISSDGQYVVFQSAATDLVAGGSVNTNIFVHDRSNGETIQVSVDSNGNGATTGDSMMPDISSDGRYVVFQSAATDLVGNDNGGIDIFVHDRDSDGNGIFDEGGVGDIETTRVSLASDGSGGASGDSTMPTISADGRYVNFQSTATDLVIGGGSVFIEIFDHDRDSDGNGIFDEGGVGDIETTRVSVSFDGNSTSGASRNPAISQDGQYVAFESKAANLVPGDSNGNWDIFVHDLAAVVAEVAGANAAAGSSGGGGGGCFIGSLFDFSF